MGTETRYRERMKTRGIIAIASAAALVVVGGFVGVVTATALSQAVPTPVATVEPVVAPRVTPTPTPTMTHLPEPVPVVEAPPAPVVEEPAPEVEEPVAEEPPVVEAPVEEAPVEAAPIKCPAGSTANSGDGGNDTSCFPDECFHVTLPDPAYPQCVTAFLP